MGDTTAGRRSGNGAAGPNEADGYWYTPMPIYLLEAVYDPDCPVNAPAAMLWAHIHRNYAWRKRVFPSYATLAAETEQSESAVKRQLTALRKLGAITWGANYSAKGRSSNEYALAPVKPFAFDRDVTSAVEVKNDLHRRVEVTNDPGVEVKSDPNPQVKNDLGVKNTDELESTLSPPASTTPGVAAAEDERETSLPMEQQIVRAAAVVDQDDELAFIAWMRATNTIKGIGWWHTVANNGHLPGHAASWRQQRPKPQPVRPAGQLCHCCGTTAPVALTFHDKPYCANCTSACNTCETSMPADQLDDGTCQSCLNTRSTAA